MSGSIKTRVASVTVQVRVDAAPRVMVLGAAAKLITGAASNVTVTCADDEPPGPVAVRRYVVVVAGDTAVEPVAPRLPRSWSMETLVALLTVQESVELSPSAIVRGDAAKVICGFGGVTVTVACLVTLPPMPLAVRV